MTLSHVCLALGALHLVAGLLAVTRPARCTPALRALPRNVPLGVGLMLAGTAWFFWNLYSSDLTDFQEFRPFIYAGTILLGVGCCFFVQDYLAVRGAAVVALLGCDRILDIQRWHDSGLKNVVTVWCYAVIVAGIWFCGSPWRVRDGIAWATASESRLRQLGGVCAGFGALLALLGVTALR
jgi:hypothetical protein